MQKTKNVSAGKWVALVIALLFMFATKYIPAPADLSQAGFQVLGILIGAIILFLTWGTGCPTPCARPTSRRKRAPTTQSYSWSSA